MHFLKRVIPVVAAFLMCGAVGSASAQGCAPTRFAVEVPGTQGDIYLPRGTWQFGLAYRQLSSNRLIQGHTDMGPSSVVRSFALFGSASYAITNRASVSVTVPFSHGTHETAYADGQRHQNEATGIGDISVMASYWLFESSPFVPGGNLEVGLGLRAPTGRNDVQGTWWNADGSTTRFPVHQSIEPGGGGWGVAVRTLGFRPVASRTYVFGSGSYTFSPTHPTSVPRSPGSAQYWAIPDTWDALVGVAVAIWPDEGLSARLGMMFDGTRKRDLIGGTSPDEHRLPATSGYVNPAVTLSRGSHTVTLGMGARVYQNFLPSVWDDAAGRKGGGGLAKYIFQTTYTLRR